MPKAPPLRGFKSDPDEIWQECSSSRPRLYLRID